MTREEFETEFNRRMRYLMQKYGAAIRADLDLNAHGFAAARVDAYDHAQLMVDGALAQVRDLFAETLFPARSVVLASDADTSVGATSSQARSDERDPTSPSNHV